MAKTNISGNQNLDLNTHKITNVVDPTNNQDAATKAYVLANGGGGANTALSNLVSTAINADLIPGTDAAWNIGTPTLEFNTLYVNGLQSGGNGGPLVNMSIITSTQATGASGSVNINTGTIGASGTGVDTGQILIYSGAHSGTGNSGPISITSGDQLLSGNTGDISLATGTPTSGIRGSIKLDALNTQLFANSIIADPAYTSTYWGVPTHAVMANSTNIPVGDAFLFGSTDILTGAASLASADIGFQTGDVFNGTNPTGKTGDMWFMTGWQDSGTGASGDTGLIDFGTGFNSGAGASGHIKLYTGVTEVAASGYFSIATGATNGTLATGNVSITTGNSLISGPSGQIGISSGATVNGTSGSIQIQSGAPSTTGASGDVYFGTAGNVGSGNSGITHIYSGNTTGAGTSGWLELTTGETVATTSGSVRIQTGNPSAGGGASGNIYLVAGQMGSTPAVNTNSGFIQITNHGVTGTGSTGNIQFITGTAVNGNTGSVSLTSGDTTGSGNTGPIQLNSGAASGSGNSGDVTISTGAAAGAFASGDVVLEVGNATTKGHIRLEDNTSTGTIGHVWTSIDALGRGHWAAGGSAPKVAYISDVKASGTDGGTSATSFTQRDLNTLVDPDSIVTSLTANQFTLPAGTYLIDAQAPANKAQQHKAVLYDVTNSAIKLVGSSAYSTSSSGNDNMTSSYIRGRFTLVGSVTFEIQHIVGNDIVTVGFGAAGGFSVDEVYTQVTITKL